MNISKLIFRSIVFYWRTHVWVILGTMVSTAILVGALIIGDSIRHSLQQIVSDRLGKTQFVLSSGNRFFHTQTSERLSEKLQTPVAPLLETKGIAIVGAGNQRMNNVRVIGVDNRFGTLGDTSGYYENISSDEAVINDQLAFNLQLNKGDEFLIRVENLDFIPKDIPLALDSEMVFVKRVTVKSIVSKKEFGGFNLKADQVTPNTVFVSLDFLGREMGLDYKSNVLLVAEKQDAPLSIKKVNEAFKEIWSLSDAGYELDQITDINQIELKSERIFLDSTVVNEVQKIYKNSQQIFSYFVNEICLQDKSTPYSFVSALSDLDLKEDEILINEWLANDLHAQKGNQIKLSYYILGSSRSLIETSSDFRVKSIVPMEGVYADKKLMPEFPGFVDVENCREWDPGIPIDLDKIRKKDEEYWDNYRGTPKVFLSLRTAQKIWDNRFGNLTAMRFPNEDIERVRENLTKAIDPVCLGFYFHDVKNEGLLASAQSVDFAQLFLGLSFFIIIAALLLTGLLYLFNSEQRSEEIGLFLALGFTKKSIKHIMLLEGLILVIIGSLLGAVCGVVYNQIVLLALKSIWKNIVGTSFIQIYIKYSTVILGILIGVIINLFTILMVTGNQLKQPIAVLQKGITKLETIKSKKTRLSLAICVLCFISVFLILIMSNTGRERDLVIPFFSAGFLLLIGGIAFVNFFIVKKVDHVNDTKLSLVNIGIRNNIRKRFRSLAIIALLACGIFIVFTVGANRRNLSNNAEKRESGTGGFALFGESVIPILYDLNSEQGHNFYSLSEIDVENVKFVSFRVKEGEDASCLNLNRVSTPQLIGVNPDELSKRNSFSFAKTTEEVNSKSPWDILEQVFPGDVIPGIADQTVIVWGLGKSVGDTLIYVDESGKTFKIKLVGGLANSIFQGNIIISEKAFINKYPSISGSKLFLVDAPFSKIESIKQKISRALQDQGIDLIPTYDRLAQFAKVENTYLSIFLLLGTFGLILGSIGINIVIGRNVFERRGELALLQSVGFSRKAIQLLILSEHSLLLFAGISIGIVSALLATLPTLMQPGSNIPYLTIIFLLVIVTLNGGFWTCFASFMATKKDLLPALRNE
ncbi:FtsX-like permease family protein [Candidatus Latescibacterota bacterium]